MKTKLFMIPGTEYGFIVRQKNPSASVHVAFYGPCPIMADGTSAESSCMLGPADAMDKRYIDPKMAAAYGFSFDMEDVVLEPAEVEVVNG